MASSSSSPHGCSTRVKPSYIFAEHFVTLVFPTPGLFLVLALRLLYENVAYRWLITTPTSASLHSVNLPLLERWSPLYNCGPSSVPSSQMVDGSKVTFLASVLSIHLPLLSTSELYGQPRTPHCLRCGFLVCPSSPWSSFPGTFPLVFPSFNTRWSVPWLERCSKVPVSGSFSGSLLDSPFDL